jgi:hypothetical protein
MAGRVRFSVPHTPMEIPVYLCWAKATRKSILGLNKWDECAVNKCFLCPNRSYRNKHGCQLNYNSLDLIMKSKHFRLNCITPPLRFITMWFWLCIFFNLMNFISTHWFNVKWRLASHVHLLYMCMLPKDNLREKCTTPKTNRTKILEENGAWNLSTHNERIRRTRLLCSVTLFSLTC